MSAWHVEREALRLRHSVGVNSASDWAHYFGLPDICWVSAFLDGRNVDGMAFVDVERPGGYMVQPRSASWMFSAQAVLLCERLVDPPAELAALATLTLVQGRATIWRL